MNLFGVKKITWRMVILEVRGGGDGKGGGGTLTNIALHDRLERYSKVQV